MRWFELAQFVRIVKLADIEMLSTLFFGFGFLKKHTGNSPIGTCNNSGIHKVIEQFTCNL